MLPFHKLVPFVGEKTKSINLKIHTTKLLKYPLKNTPFYQLKNFCDISHPPPPLYNTLISNKIHLRSKPLKIAFCDITNLVNPSKVSNFAPEFQTICLTFKSTKNYEKKISFYNWSNVALL